MRVHVIYRLYGGENRKGRPDYYSKYACLASLLRAAREADVETVVLADGPLPEPLRALAAQADRLIDLPGGPVGMRASFLAAIVTPDRLEWPDDDVVYFCEDDYLHRADALTALAEAAVAVGEASYFALYASTPEHPAVAPGTSARMPHDWRAHPGATVGGRRWVNVPSTASTFGARIGALRADLGIIRQGMVPYPTRFLDHEMCLVFQGRFPYSLTEVLIGSPETRFRTGAKALAANIFLAPFRLAYNVRALTRRRRPHLLYAVDPNLATHMESDLMAAGTDWAEIAASADAWSEAPSTSSDSPGG